MMNKRYYFTLILIQVLAFSVFTLQAAIKIEPLPYDSMRNYVGANPRQYIGQQLYVKGLPDNMKELGYSGFVIDYRKDDVILNDRKNVYKVGDGYNSLYTALVGRFFDVVDVITHPQAKNNPDEYGKYSYLKLQAQPEGDIIYYRYDSKASNLSFPFIVIGFYDKQRELLNNQSFVFAKKTLANPLNIKNNLPVKYNMPGMKWKCFSLAIDPEKYQLAVILQNSYSERIIVPYEIIDPNTGDGRKAYTAEEYDTYMKRFGKIKFNSVLENVVKTGMTKEMCRLAWGEPIKTEKNGTTEIWTYPSGLLEFTGDTLKQVK